MSTHSGLKFISSVEKLIKVEVKSKSRHIHYYYSTLIQELVNEYEKYIYELTDILIPLKRLPWKICPMIPLPKGISLPDRSYLCEDSMYVKPEIPAPKPEKKNIPVKPATTKNHMNPVTTNIPVETVTTNIPVKPVTSNIYVKPVTTNIPVKPVTTNIPNPVKPVIKDCIPVQSGTTNVSEKLVSSILIKPDKAVSVIPKTEVPVKTSNPVKSENGNTADNNKSNATTLKSPIKILKRVPLAPVNNSGDRNAIRGEDKSKIHQIHNCEDKSSAYVGRRWKIK